MKLRYENGRWWQCEEMKEVDKFNYWRVKISTDSRYAGESDSQGRKVWGTMTKL